MIICFVIVFCNVGLEGGWFFNVLFVFIIFMDCFFVVVFFFIGVECRFLSEGFILFNFVSVLFLFFEKFSLKCVVF